MKAAQLRLTSLSFPAVMRTGTSMNFRVKSVVGTPLVGTAAHFGAALWVRQRTGWSVGADTAVAVVSEGAGGQYDSAVIGKPILGFIFGEKGLLADVSLEGSKITKIKATS